MFNIFGTIFSIGVSVALILMFRYLDRNGRSLEKVKKYTDKIKGDLDARFGEQLQKLNAAAVDIDVRQSQAIATVKRLEKQIEDFQLISENLSGRLAAIDEIDKKLSSYDSLLQQVMEMTANLEENMLRVGKESDAVGKLEKKVHDYMKTAAALEEKIPSLTAEFAASNDERLKQIGTDLLSRFKVQVAELEDSVRQAVSKNDELLASIDTRVQNAHAEAVRKAESLENDALKGFMDRSAARFAECGIALNEKTAGLQEEIAAASASLREELESVSAQTEKTADRLASELQDAEGKLDALELSVRQRVSELENTYRDSFTQARAEAETDARRLLDSFEIESAKNMEETEKYLDSRLSGIQSLVDTTVSALQTSLAEADARSRELTETGNGMQLSLDGLQNDLARKTDELAQRMTALFEQAASDADESAQQMASRYAERAESRLEELKNSLNTKIAAVQESAEAYRAASAEETQKALAGMQDDVRRTAESVGAVIAKIEDTWRVADEAAQQSEQRLSAKNEETVRRFEDFAAAMKDKLAEFDVSVADSMKKIAGSYDARQTAFLANLDKQLEDYKEDMQYRFERLDTAGADVDTLEADLRQAMLEAQKRVLNEFQTFNGEQQQRQAEFELAVRKNSDDIARQIKTIEADLEELKARAYDNVSAKLQDFETEFLADLGKRGETLTSDLDRWKDDFDGKLSVMQSDYENERRSLELKYGEDLKDRLSVLHEKTREQVSRFEDSAKQSERAVQERIAAVERGLHEFVDQYRDGLQNAKAAVDLQLKKDLEAYTTAVNEQLSRAEKDINDRLDGLNGTVAAAQDKSGDAIDGLVSELAAWQERLRAQFDESRTLFGGKLDSLKQQSADMIEQVKLSFESDIADYGEKIAEERSGIAQKLESLKTETNQTLADCETRAAGVMEDFQKTYDALLEDTQRRIREQNSDAEQKLRALKTLVQEIRDKNEAAQSQMVLKMQADANTLNMSMDDIDKRLKQFTAQLPLFDKAEDLKSKLEEEIAGLRADIGNLENFKKEISVLDQEFQRMRKMEDEVNQKLLKFSSEKKHIEMLESDFNRLMQLSSSMDQKISELQTTNDDLQNLQIEVRRFQDTLSNISVRYDRLEKKNDVLDRTILDVDKAFTNLEQLEKRLEACNGQVVQIPEKIDGVRRDVDRLVDNSGRISDAVEKLDALDNVISETEKHIGEVMNAREGIVNSEKRLQEIAKTADEQVKLLGALLRKDTARESGAAGAPPISVREQVIQLAHQNWTVKEIARGLKLTEAEVELILEMPR
ncbi:SpiroCoCo family coiled-coil protein [Treponema brennaborense]|uniref:Uncharacterized protein n=1 Tax=Treponema brennaborense (strain DSM 12168 / CIP 105900 / DD5/3) TaxID=906968 RepID=F4LJC0_TREBD|nr:hypothetical protein [Treponema brennaborense]AEE17365.1 hypothetical protein Trebr_1947 [Treponema brennaborense DSM 12168]